ncbi:protein SCO1 homolog, mitochondrial [Trichonephila inaurata madagascariensis]|uniref:Protein SCO1 homolog, mitochondrial n=1 Tax=Trichonephila inaurata madagascariensis TaxID=2747483 RepID=A0A8X6Y8Y0_9ARAC|nr:protein SCO1 homolog, mitochondrial [Trichonephila inaurata madagascariensis]
MLIVNPTALSLNLIQRISFVKAFNVQSLKPLKSLTVRYYTTSELFSHTTLRPKLSTSLSNRLFISYTPKAFAHQLPKKKVWGKNKGPISWKTFLITLGIGGVFVVLMQYVKKEKQIELDKQRRRELGKAAIGGRFDLVDHTGKPKSSEDYFGNWLLIYFGFTHCPDICPEEIEKMITVVDDLHKSDNLPKIIPLFITVDPERDSVDAVAKYVKEFSPKLIGLTGTKEQVHAVTKAFRVYYSAGPKDVDDDYIVDHTIITYLVDPEGQFIDYYGQTKTAEQVVNSITLQMMKYQSVKKKSFF